MDEIYCSNLSCDRKIFLKCQDGYWRFTTRALKIKDEGHGLVGVCRKCNTETELPYSITSEVLIKSKDKKEEFKSGFTVFVESKQQKNKKERT